MIQTGNNNNLDPTCTEVPSVFQCEGLPFHMVMLYNGGNCSQSFNVQDSQGLFLCEDFNGGPPTQRGTESWIRVTDLGGTRIYHDNSVEVGNTFTLDDGNTRFVANQLIKMYNSSQLIPENLIQTVQYHSSCSANLFLLDRFGAAQLMQWTNEDQGTICFPI